jgi:hypothetical protein
MPVSCSLRPHHSIGVVPVRLNSPSDSVSQTQTPLFELTNQARHKKLCVDNKLATIVHQRFEAEVGEYPVLYVDFSVSDCIDHFQRYEVN